MNKLLKVNAMKLPDETFVRDIRLERVDSSHGDGGPGTERVKVTYLLTFTDSDGNQSTAERSSRIVATQLYYTNIDLWLDAGGWFVAVVEARGAGR